MDCDLKDVIPLARSMDREMEKRQWGKAPGQVALDPGMSGSEVSVVRTPEGNHHVFTNVKEPMTATEVQNRTYQHQMEPKFLQPLIEANIKRMEEAFALKPSLLRDVLTDDEMRDHLKAVPLPKEPMTATEVRQRQADWKVPSPAFQILLDDYHKQLEAVLLSTPPVKEPSASNESADRPGEHIDLRPGGLNFTPCPQSLLSGAPKASKASFKPFKIDWEKVAKEQMRKLAIQD
jgi:hypothetical protein